MHDPLMSRVQFVFLAASAAGIGIIHFNCHNLMRADGDTDLPILDRQRGAFGTLHQIRLGCACKPGRKGNTHLSCVAGPLIYMENQRVAVLGFLYSSQRNMTRLDRVTPNADEAREIAGGQTEQARQLNARRTIVVQLPACGKSQTSATCKPRPPAPRPLGLVHCRSSVPPRVASGGTGNSTVSGFVARNRGP